MPLLKSWLSLEEAESKYGIKRELMLKWVEEGIVRCEEREGRIVRVNADDLELKVAERAKM